MLRNTIDDENQKFIRWKRMVARDPQLEVSVFDPDLINPADLAIPRTGAVEEPVMEEPVAKAAVQAEPAYIPAPVAEEPAPAAEDPAPVEEIPVPEEAPAAEPTPVSEAAAQEKKTAAPRRKSVTGDVRYSIYGKEYEENQSDMMLRVFAQVLRRHPECVDTLPQQTGMNCAARWADITKPGTREAKPSYFRICQNFTFDNGASVCIGTAYGNDEKLRKIALLMDICGEDRGVFRSEQVELPELASRRPGRPAAPRQEPKSARGKKEKNFMD